MAILLIASYLLANILRVLGGGVYNEIDVDIGSKVELTCKVDAGIESQIYWIRSSDPPVVLNNMKTNGYSTSRGGQYLQIDSISEADSSIFTCYHNDTVLTMFDLKVHLQSTFSGTLDCVTSYTFSTMNCCWRSDNCGSNCKHILEYQLRSEESDEVSFMKHLLSVKNGTCQGVFNKESNAEISTLCCDVPLNMTDVNDAFITYTVAMKATLRNSFYSAISRSVTEYPLSWVKPCPPGNVSLEMIHKQNRFFVNVNWSPPNMKSLDFIYRVRYRIVDAAIEDDWKIIDLIFFNDYTIDHVRHNSLVEVQVGATPHDLVGGFWSDWTQSEVVATGQLAPVYEMHTTNVSYTTFQHNNGAVLDFHWKPYIAQMDPDFYNVLQFCDCKNQCTRVNVTADRNNYSALVCLGKASVKGYYCNSRGCSPESQETNLSGNGNSYSARNINFKLLQNKAYRVSWDSNGKLEHSCKVQIFALSRLQEFPQNLEVTDYHQNAYLATEETIPCSDEEITRQFNHSNCLQYIATVSVVWLKDNVEYAHLNSFNKWIVVKDNEPFQEVEILSSYNITNNSTTVRIDEHDMYSERLFFAYRPLAFETPYTAWRIANIEREETRLTHLDGYTEYEVRVVDCCQAAPMIVNGSSCCRMLNATGIYFTTEIGEPSIVASIVWDWNEGMVKWAEPVPANGPIDGYFVSYEYSLEVIFENLTSETPFFHFAHLCHEHGSVNLTITAYNFVNDVALIGRPSVLSVDCDKLVASMHVVMALALTGFVVVVFTSMALWCYRRKVKYAITKFLWPSVPAPRVMVPKPQGGWRVSDAPTTNDEQNHELVNLLSTSPSYEIVDELHSEEQSPIVSESDEEKEYVATYQSSNASCSTIPLYSISKQKHRAKLLSIDGSLSIPSYLLCDSGIYTSFNETTKGAALNDKIKYSQMVSEIGEGGNKDKNNFDPLSINIAYEVNLLSSKSALLNKGTLEHGNSMLTPSKSCISVYSVVSGTSYVKDILPSYLRRVSQDYVYNEDYFIENCIFPQ